jgi:hypothetical protein
MHYQGHSFVDLLHDSAGAGRHDGEIDPPVDVVRLSGRPDSRERDGAVEVDVIGLLAPGRTLCGSIFRAETSIERA